MTKKIRVARAYILGGDRLFGHVVDADGKGLKPVAAGEVADDKVIQGKGEGHDQPREDAGEDLRQLYLGEARKGVQPGPWQPLGGRGPSAAAWAAPVGSHRAGRR